MKFAAVLCVLVACGGPAPEVAKPEPTQAPFKLPRHVDRVGDVRLEHKTEVIEEKHGVTAGTQREEYRRRITILAVRDGVPAKIRVAYEHQTFSVSVGGVERKTDAPSLDGNTYVLERVSDGVDVIKQNGTLTKEEGDAVLGDNTFVTPNQFLDVLAGRTWKIGELVELDAAVVSGSKDVTGTTSIRLVGYDKDVARFEVHAIHKIGTLAMDMKMKVELDVRDPMYGSYKSTGTGADHEMTSSAQATIVVSRAR